ncbi:MAG: GNAT family N-acetyltransferase [Candidatus Binatus sp.]|jgi:GNAT superfamily N-acetyltransferase|uniref:GNAT family N-acetyltransferase n=1 Tax=Candidatus Binatus sp. TaxID=2811406 RepID=UPI003C746825
MKRKQVRIRRARLGDESEIEDLYRQLHEGDYKSPGATKMRRAMRSLLLRPDEILLVAVRDGHVVGTNHILIFRHLARTLRPSAILENMVVDSRSRGAGVGDLLMEAALKVARRRGCYKLSLTSNRKRPRAHNFYENFGMTHSHKGYTIYLQK